MSKSLAHLNQSSEFSSASTIAWYDQGDALANLGDYEAALNCFDNVLEIQPTHHAAWVFRGVVLIHLERYEEALESCENALKHNPRDSEAFTFRGVALHRLGRYQEAYESYEKALGVRQQSLRQQLGQSLRKIHKMFTSWQFRRLS
ncbi:MAG TPA: tetratricopeptide repeat protein [Crinalium sp.]|jgi:tetratricopeptide (TPR) repeat protein